MKTSSFRKLLLGISASALSCMMVLAGILPNFRRSEVSANSRPTAISETSEITDITGKARVDLRDYLDKSVTQKLPEAVSPDREISVMVSLDTDTLLDGYDALGETSMSVADYSVSREGRSIVSRIEKESRALQNKLTRAGVKYEVGVSYNTLLGGFEAVIRAGEFEKLQAAVGKSANVIVSEEYAMSEYTKSSDLEIVENEVKVAGTGIFDTKDSKYSGKGTVVAVLDSGLDYNHPAFDVSRFQGEEKISKESISAVVDKLTAKSMTPSLTASDVYINSKIPYAYDYADGDPDVYPINSDHGTHVSGIVVGNDDTIRGVAPNAQLAFIKVFSEKNQSAKQSWIVAGLEDCIILDVDVINMSLGTSASFAREVDTELGAEVYDRVREHGISLVAACSNDGSSAQGSEKNGSLSLTTNPDTATVGAPSTYDSSLSVASIAGVKTSYMLHAGRIIYFEEAMGASLKDHDFVDEILPEGENEREFEYVIIAGVGTSVDYDGVDMQGKIALVKRGVTNFEDKIRLAQRSGAAGIIIYNNVSGEIHMTVGTVTFPACSISLDDAQPLLNAESGKRIIKISRDQAAGPFMSSFSSWGPTPDLGIKPEITAHGGKILSAIPGGRYDRFDGTSMASPNQAGLTTLVRQYVIEKFPNYTKPEIAAMTNQLMMSTADIAINTNSLPFAVRKQGAGLTNLEEATTTPAYIRTYERYQPDKLSDKAKLELGDDPQKTGVYSFKFELVNIGDSAVSYDVSAFAMTEGLAEKLTVRGDRTIDEKGYQLTGAKTNVKNVSNGQMSGNRITVNAGQVAVVEAEIVLSDEDKAYLNQKNNAGNLVFENGMYVEGYVKLTAADGTKIDLNVPYLTFFGDWTQAPIFDLDWFETNATEINASIPDDDKVLADYCPTRAIGSLYDDYITYLGGIPYETDPASTLLVPADRDKIALSNQDGEYGGVNGISSIWCGFLRGAKYATITITDDATGELIWEKDAWNLRKALYYGGGHSPSIFDVDFLMRDFDLKNNSKYNVVVTAYLDYGTQGDANYGGLQTNRRNTFEFPFYTDFESPIATDIEYTYEYDKSSRTNKLFANISIYDNHYLLGYLAGTITENSEYDRNDPDSYLYNMDGFSQYVTPVPGARNSTSVIKIDLTDHLEDIRNSYNHRSFVVQMMDYANNTSNYEFQIPDNIKYIEFDEMKELDEDGNPVGLRISPNQLYRLIPNIQPQTESDAWYETIVYTSDNENVAKVVDGQLLGVNPGHAVITATSAADPTVKNYLDVTVLKEGDDGYVKYDTPYAETFYLGGYYVNKVFYRMNSDDRDLGVDKATNDRGDYKYVILKPQRSYGLSMFPSETVTVDPVINGYYDEGRYKVEYVSSDSAVVEVDENGKITAKNVDSQGKALNTDRAASISISLYMRNDQGEYEATGDSISIYVNVKKPYITNATPYLYNYFGLGGEVEIPQDLNLMYIYEYAFSNYEYIPKDLSAGDVIDREDPYTMKQWFIGEDTITKVIVPEGVETIERYAFAGLTNLKEVVLPSTLYKLQVGAFYGCKSLSKVTFNNGNKLQFINADCFYGCESLTSFPFDSIEGIGENAFQGAGLIQVELPKSTQSIAAGAFRNNTRMTSLTMRADLIKLGANAFENCSRLTSVNINANVIPDGAFEECTMLSDVTLGEDVQVVGQNAFRHTLVKEFHVADDHPVFASGQGTGGNYLVEKNTGRLALVAPTVSNFSVTDNSITIIGAGAFSTAGTSLSSVTLPSVTVVEDYGLAYCAGLRTVKLGNLTYVGSHAFYGDSILTQLPNLAQDESTFIGDYAFAATGILNATISDNLVLGTYSFAENTSMTKATIGDNVKIGDHAFYGNVKLGTVKIGDNVEIGDYAFSGLSSKEYVDRNNWTESRVEYATSGHQVTYNGSKANTTVLPTLSAISSLEIGSNAVIGDYAFYGAGSGEYTFVREDDRQEKYNGGVLKSVTLGEGATIGAYAFHGCRNLNSIDLSHAKSIGENAFSGSLTEYLLFSGGESLVMGELVTAAPLTNVNLSAAESLGAGIFKGNDKLTELNLGSIAELPEEIFSGCKGLKEVDLSQVSIIGRDAFKDAAMTSVSLKEGVEIGEGAFYGNAALGTVNNLDKAVVIGANAFRNTALTSATLSSAKRIGDFAFAGSKLTGDVVLGDELTDLGENPFSGCDIHEFTKNGDGVTKDFALAGGIVKVVDGVLYRTKINGMEIICYPKGKTGRDFTIEEDTIRVGAEAFRDCKLSVVTIPRAVRAIGDKAFYGCTALTAVNFRSINAPRLEEAYDYTYDDAIDERGLDLYLRDSVGNIDISFRDGSSVKMGKGFVPYKMWGYSATTVLYGANFVYGIIDEAQQTHTLVMVRPKNAKGYESFNYLCYFDSVLLGADTLTDQGAAVMAAIKSLPDAMNLRAEDYDRVYEIYNLYMALLDADKTILSADGYATTLLNAKGIVDTLRPVDETNSGEEEAKKTNLTWLWYLLVAVAGCAVGAFATYLIAGRKNDENENSDGGNEGEKSTEKSQEEKSEEKSDNE